MAPTDPVTPEGLEGSPSGPSAASRAAVPLTGRGGHQRCREFREGFCAGEAGAVTRLFQAADAAAPLRSFCA